MNLEEFIQVNKLIPTGTVLSRNWFLHREIRYSEEKVRLKKSPELFFENLNDDASGGKKLSFIGQEIGRSKHDRFQSQWCQYAKAVNWMKDELENQRTGVEPSENDTRETSSFLWPSGGGKTTIVHHLLQKKSTDRIFVSATTRPQRANEVDGKDYHFISVEDFKKRIANDEFVEWEEVYTDRFLRNIEIWNWTHLERSQSGDLWCVDVEGGLKIKNLRANVAGSICNASVGGSIVISVCMHGIRNCWII